MTLHALQQSFQSRQLVGAEVAGCLLPHLPRNHRNLLPQRRGGFGETDNMTAPVFGHRDPLHQPGSFHAIEKSYNRRWFDKHFAREFTLRQFPGHREPAEHLHLPKRDSVRSETFRKPTVVCLRGERQPHAKTFVEIVVVAIHALSSFCRTAAKSLARAMNSTLR